MKKLIKRLIFLPYGKLVFDAFATIVKTRLNYFPTKFTKETDFSLRYDYNFHLRRIVVLNLLGR